jgi:hypothetical protein
MQKTFFIVSAFVLSGFAGLVPQTLAEDKPGYTDTPMLPSGKWHVHDPNRPVPPIITPGLTFSHGAPAPSDALVLFDGTDFSHWEGDKGAPQWTIHGDYMECKPHSGYIHTKEKFGDFQLHIEWAEPKKIDGNSQDRGNSGVFLQGIYEVQVLDSFDNPTYPDGQCGALYGQSPPLANACKKPDQWQTYDIVFEAARWNQNHELVRPACVTVFQNGVVIHHKQPLLGPTGHRTLAKYDKEYPATGPISLQDHGNTVRFRNIWIRNLPQEEKP